MCPIAHIGLKRVSLTVDNTLFYLTSGQRQLSKLSWVRRALRAHLRFGSTIEGSTYLFIMKYT